MLNIMTGITFASLALLIAIRKAQRKNIGQIASEISTGIALSVIASYIFFYINIYLPQYQLEQKAAPKIAHLIDKTRRHILFCNYLFVETTDFALSSSLITNTSKEEKAKKWKKKEVREVTFGLFNTIQNQIYNEYHSLHFATTDSTLKYKYENYYRSLLSDVNTFSISNEEENNLYFTLLLNTALLDAFIGDIVNESKRGDHLSQEILASMSTKLCGYESYAPPTGQKNFLQLAPDGHQVKFENTQSNNFPTVHEIFNHYSKLLPEHNGLLQVLVGDWD